MKIDKVQDFRFVCQLLLMTLANFQVISQSDRQPLPPHCTCRCFVLFHPARPLGDANASFFVVVFSNYSLFVFNPFFQFCIGFRWRFQIHLLTITIQVLNSAEVALKFQPHRIRRHNKTSFEIWFANSIR